MKNKLISITLAASLCLVTGTGIAGTEGENYFGLQYGYANYDESGVSKTYKPTAFVARFGRFLTPNFAIEGRLGTGLDDDTHNLSEFGDRDVTLEIDSIFGLYGTGHFNITETSSIYGVLGVGWVKSSANMPDLRRLESTEKNSSVSYGIGADIGIGSRWALNIEYMQYLDKDDFDVGMASVGASFSF